MKNEKILESVQKAQTNITKAGFPWMKFELEAHLFRSSSWSETKCSNFIDKFVGPELMKKVVFRWFYNDGSVDSELTITLATEDAHLIIHWIEAFNALAKTIGRGIQTANAGFHIAVMGNSSYPVTSHYLDPGKIANFATQVTKLMPALLFASTHNHQTRKLGYRKPVISNNKYSAIAIRCGVFEYRIFDTCYDKPEAVYDKIEIIAATLKFYSHRKNAAKLDQNIPIRDGGIISQIFDNPEIVAALTSSLPYVRPAYKTVDQMRNERGFSLDPATARRLRLKREAQEIIQLRSAHATWEKQAKLELRQFKVEIKDLKGWKSLEKDDQKAMDYLMENNFIPRQPTRDIIRARLNGSPTNKPHIIRATPSMINVN